MALEVARGTLQVNFNTVGNTFTVNGLSFQPKAVILWWNGRDDATDAQGESDHYRGWGFFTSTTSRRCIGTYNVNNSASADSGISQYQTACMAIPLLSNAIDGLMDVNAINSDGFQLIVDDATAASLALDVEWLALGGTDITDAVTDRAVSPASAGNWDVTSLAFQPTFVLFLGTAFTSAVDPGSTNVDTRMCLGWARVDQDGTSNVVQGVWAGGSDDAAADMQTVSYCTDAECYAALNSGLTGFSIREAFVQALSNGFRLNQTGTTGSIKIEFLAIRAGNANVKAGSLLTRTDANDIVVSSIGHQPKGLVFLSHGKAQSTTGTLQDHDEWSLGAATSPTARSARGVVDEDAAADSNIGTAVEYDEVYINQSTANPPVIEGLMDLKSIETTGFTCVMDDPDPSAAFVLWLSVGEVAAADQNVPVKFPRQVLGEVW